MRFLLLLLVALASLGLVAFTSTRLAESVPVEAETFRVDPMHSNVLFKIKHNGVSWFYGRFGEISGEFSFDAEEPANSEVLIEIKAESVDTRSEKLDQHLRSPDFFDTEQFPLISFVSSKVEQTSEHLFKVTGELSLHGVSKEITIELEHVGTSDGRRGKVIGFHTTFTVNRRDYGMNFGMPSMLGDDVELIISIEAGRR